MRIFRHNIFNLTLLLPAVLIMLLHDFIPHHNHHKMEDCERFEIMIDFAVKCHSHEDFTEKDNHDSDEHCCHFYNYRLNENDILNFFIQASGVKIDVKFIELFRTINKNIVQYIFIPPKLTFSLRAPPFFMV